MGPTFHNISSRKEEEEVQQLLQQAPDQIRPQESAIFVKDYDLHDDADRKLYTDQTGRFPVTSFKGNQYIMVIFETTTNNILVEPMRNRVSGEMVRAYQVLMDRLREKSIKPTMQILDNESPLNTKRLSR